MFCPTLVMLKKSILSSRIRCSMHVSMSHNSYIRLLIFYSVFVRDTINSTVVVACGQFRVRDCASLKISLFCSTQPVIESSRELQFSCYQFYYNQLAGRYFLANKHDIKENRKIIDTYKLQCDMSSIYASCLL